MKKTIDILLQWNAPYPYNEPSYIDGAYGIKSYNTRERNINHGIQVIFNY